MQATSVEVNEINAAPISIVRPLPRNTRNTGNLKLLVGRGSLRFATILQRVAVNDKTAINECIDTYGNMIWGMAKRFSGSTEEAEIVTRDIFQALWAEAKDFDPARTDETSFIATIACDRLNEVAKGKRVCRSYANTTHSLSLVG
jgi:hypothetical protein